MLTRSASAESSSIRPPARTAYSDEHAYRFVDWLAAAGQRWWQVLPLGPPDEHRLAVQVAVGVRRLARRCSREPGARCRAREREAFRARHAYWIDDWVAFAGGARRRPGALRPRVERAPRATPRERGVRIFGDMPIYVARGGADHVAHPELFQRRRRSPACRPTLFARDGQLWGNPLYDWPAMRRRRLPLVDRALPAHLRARRPDARRPLPRLRRVLGGAERQQDGARRALAARARGARCSTPSGGARRRCRSSPRTSA